MAERDLAGVAGGAPGDIEHPAEDAAADLDRPFELGEVDRGDRRVERALVDLFAQLLDERQDGAQGVVHVVRDAAGEVGHRVLAFRDQHSLLERFGPPRVSQGDGRLGEELRDRARLRNG